MKAIQWFSNDVAFSRIWKNRISTKRIMKSRRNGFSSNWISNVVLMKEPSYVDSGIQSQSSSSLTTNKKWKMNYVMVIALIGEFCNRWIINIFDVSFAEFGEERYHMSSSEFRYICSYWLSLSFTTALGSVINVIQTGWLFNVFLKWGLSIPLITSFAGITGRILLD